MSVYNGMQFLPSAIDSILDQTYKDFEFIIIDDASTDATQQVLSRYTDRRIVHLRNELNLGLARSLNRGLAIARGAYIARQDADDESLAERLALQVSYLDRHPCVGVVGSTACWIDDNGKELEIWRKPTQNAVLQEHLLDYCPIVHGSVMMRKVALADVGGQYTDAYRTGQDYDLWLRISEGWDFAVLEDVLYRYRWHAAMVSQQRQREQLANAQEAVMRAVERRLAFGKARLGLASNEVPDWVRQASRRWWAQRYVWWSQGTRKLGRGIAARFLAIAVLLDPTTPEIWRYLAGIVGRKTKRVFR